MSIETLSMGERIGRWFGNPPREGVDALPVRVHGREFARTGAAPGNIKGFDQPLIWAIAGLLMWGLVMVYSASIALNDNAPTSHVWHAQYLARHALSVCIGFVVALLVFQVPMERWEKAAPWVFIVSIVLLIAVLLPFIGKSVNGARRWISFGFINFQPSELAKLGTLLYAANYMVRKMDVKEKFFAAVTPMGVAIAIVGLGILFLGGVNARMFILITGILLTAFALMIALSPWRRERIFAYLDPFGAEHALGKGFQLSHSLIAFGRGEIFGVGLGGSVEKLHWLPEAHTDFLLAVLGEEFGLVGVVIVIGVFMWLTRRIMFIGRQAIAMDRVFSGLVAQGVGVWIGFQAFINMGVNLGALPTKGLTLPLMSFGGSAILMNLVALAIVFRVDYENRLMMHGGRV